MATVTKSTSAPINKAAALGIRKPDALVLRLPTEPEETTGTLDSAYILLHGEAKIGKTTLAMQEPNSLLITFDPKQKFLDGVLQVYCPDWRHFAGYMELLEKQAKEGKFRYGKIVIDGADIWYGHCQEFVCKQQLVKHPSEGDYGKVWDALKTLFASYVDRLFALPCGCWIISHSEWKEIETRRAGAKVTKLTPLLKARAEEIIGGRVDGIFAYDYNEDERVLIVRGDERTGAGNRMDGHFLTPKGRQIQEIPMGKSPEQAFKNLHDAFDNKQTFVTLAERDELATKAKGGNGKPTTAPVKK